MDSNPFADPFKKQSEIPNYETSQVNLVPSTPLNISNSPFSYQEYNPVVNQEYNQGPSQPVQQTFSIADDPNKRYQELERKAAQLQAKERQLNEQMGRSRPVNNWPPFSICHKCFYHDISADIPPEFQSTMRIAYYGWIAFCSILFLNVCSCLAVFAHDSKNHESSISFGLSLVIFAVLPPISFVCWYRSVYKAFRVDSSLSFFFFFFSYGFQILVTIIMALGIPGGGTCGWINGFTIISRSYSIGGVAITCALMFSALSALQIYTLVKVHMYYRSMGASAYRARDELASMGQAGKSGLIRGLVQ